MISIVVTVHNQADFLASAVDSALCQTQSAGEVIVVDDGSTDTSRDVIRSYGDSVSPILRPNGGQAAAWNTAFAVAKGDWVLFLDADDRLAPHAISAIEARLRDVTGSSKIHWRMRLVDECGAPLGIEIPDAMLPRGDRLPELIEFGFDRGPNLASSANVWSAAFLRQVMPMPEQPFRIGADTYLLGLSPLYGTTVAIDEVCSDYRCHPGNNGAQGSARFRAREIVRRSTLVFGLVAEELGRRGHRVDPARWRTRNPVYARYSRIAEEPAMPDPVYVALQGMLRVVEALGRRHRQSGPLPDPAVFPWLTTLSSSAAAIEAEAQGLFRRLTALDTHSLNPLSVGVTGSWRLVPLVDRAGPYPYLSGLPVTYSVLAHIPGLRAADFAVLNSGSRIAPHVGDNWGVLRAHLALVVPPGDAPCALRFPQHGIEVPWTPGSAFIFDDTFKHEAVNCRTSDRMVLLVEVDRPLPPAQAALNRLSQRWYRKHPVQRGVRARVLAAYERASQ